MKPEQIALARRVLGYMTQADLAAVLDVHPQTVSKWERGIQTPSVLKRQLLTGVLEHADELDGRDAGWRITSSVRMRDYKGALLRLLRFSCGYE